MAADVPRKDGSFYSAVTVPATWGAGDDVGFVANRWKMVLQSGGPVEFSFDAGETLAGVLGPSGTLPMDVELETCASRVWFKGASAPTVSVWANIT